MKRYISMSKFGRYGRFANQMIQYSHLRIWAKLYDLELQLPEWAGTKLFGCTEPLVTKQLPAFREPGRGLRHSEYPRPEQIIDHDFQGFAQYHTSNLADHKNFIRSLFQPVLAVAERVEPARALLLSKGKTLVGIHLRRGDYGQTIFPITPVSWYLKWLKENWSRFDDPIMFIATEDTSLVAEFAEYNPQTINTLGIEVEKNTKDISTLKHDVEMQNWHAMDYYPDFYLLSQSDILVQPNSTFSYWAGILSETLQEHWRADLDAADFERIETWNSYPILRQDVRAYPHLKGIALTSNKYW